MSRNAPAVAVAAASTGVLALLAGTGGGATAADAPPAPGSLAISATGTGKAAGFKAPSSIAAGLVTITFKNGLKAPADAQLVRYDAGHTVAQVEKLFASPSAKTPAWLHIEGGVGAVAPGRTGHSTQVLAPGNYVVANPDPDVPAKAAAFSVTGTVPADATLPSVPASITAKEYGFTFSGLKAGKNLVRFANTGREDHHAVIFRTVGKPTASQVRKFFATEGKGAGKPPVSLSGAKSTTVIGGGEGQNAELTLGKGRYVAVCFITDRAGGPPHFVKGMVRTFAVK